MAGRSFWKDLWASKTVMAAILGSALPSAVLIVACVLQFCDTKSELRRENAALRSDLDRARDELQPFKAVALDRFGSMNSTALTNLAISLLHVQNALESVNTDVQAVQAKVAFIKELPDGRRLLGENIVSGDPQVLSRLGTQAADAYNRGDYETATRAAREYIARHDATQTVTRGVTLQTVDAAWNRNTATMLSLVAEDAMSKGEYDQALRQIQRASSIDPRPNFDVVQTMVHVLNNDMKAADQMLEKYRSQPQDRKNEYFCSLFRMGYLPAKLSPEALKQAEIGFGLTKEVKGPVRIRVSAPSSNRLMTATAYLRVVGMGKVVPIPCDDGR